MNDRALPNNQNIEFELIATLVNMTDQDFDQLYDIMVDFNTNMFYSVQHRDVAEFVKSKVLNEKTTPDITVLMDKFDYAYNYAGCGSIHVKIKDMISELKILHLRRALIYSGTNLINCGHDNDKYNSIDSIIGRVNDEAVSICENHQQMTDRTTEQTIREMLEWIQQANSSTSDKHLIKTHIPFVDEAMQLYRGQVHTIGAFQGGGKTAFALQCLRSQLQKGMHVALFCTESSASEMLMRMFASQMGRSMSELLSGLKGIPNGLQQLQKHAVEFFQKKGNFFIYGLDDFDSNINRVYSLCSKIKRDTGKLDNVYLDYLQDLESPINGKLDERHVISKNVKIYKDMCIKFNCAGTLLSQFTQETHKDKKPTKKSFFGSGYIANASHIMSCVWEKPEGNEEEKPKEKRDVRWYSAKTRLIPEFNRGLEFNGKIGIFSELHRYDNDYRPN